MKNLISKIALVFALTFATVSFSFANDNIAKEANTNEVLTTYLNISGVGGVKIDAKIFADNFVYENLSNKSSVSKKEYVQFLKQNEGVQYNCEVSHEIFDENDNMCVAKATFSFENFTRVDYITLNKVKDSWKITKITTSYQK